MGHSATDSRPTTTHALAHSIDMHESGYVGHVSPNTGSVGDRLEAASYKGLTYGENVALNATITDAHEGLIRSLGHRRNLLSNQFTHLGRTHKGPERLVRHPDFHSTSSRQ